MIPASPDRADGVDHVARGKSAGSCCLGVAGRAAVQPRALIEDLHSPGPADRAADTRRGHERLVRGVHDRIDALLGQVADDEGDHRRASSPAVRPAGSSRTFSSASRTPGTNASRDIVSCLIVSASPGPPKTTSWWATRPGSRTEWIGGSVPMRAAVAFDVPEGAS